jgi:predicted metal-dependent peptidase
MNLNTPLPSVADRRVTNARAALVLDQPFFGVLALQLRLQNDPTCATAWTDGRSLGYNPTFIDTLDDAALHGLIAHEVMHCAAGHPWRRAGRDHAQFNQAADYAINGLLVDAGFTLPAGALLNPDYTGHCAEYIFDRLGSKPEPDPTADETGSPDNDASGDDDADGQADGQGTAQDDDAAGQGSGQPGEVRDAPPAADAPTEADWNQTVEQATRICQAQGTLPGGLARGLAEAKAPTVDWRSALRRYVQETCTADYTWTRPNVRYLSSGLFLPSLHAERCGRIVVAIDTSGSVDAVLLAQFAAELQTIADDVQPLSIDVIYCDSAVQHVDRFEAGDAITIAMHGGGGTAFSPVFEHVQASDDDAPAVLVYLTDLYGSVPDIGPDYPVVWAVTGDMGTSEVPFGDIIAID